jgi:hypothetical protein
MFEGNQNFTGSWGRNFMGNLYIYKKWKQIRWNLTSWVKVTQEIHEHWSPMNNDDSTVFCLTCTNKSETFRDLKYECAN